MRNQVPSANSAPLVCKSTNTPQPNRWLTKHSQPVANPTAVLLTLANILAALLLFVSSTAPSHAQDRDFLTPNEVDQIREVQDPNERLTLYVKFARQRMDLIQQYLAKDKPGRSVFIHNYLDDYTKIIEAIDSVSDDALLHHKDIDAGTIAVLNAEHEFLDKLNKIQDSEPKDLDRYKFLLSEAIDTTSDSQEMGKEDSAKRGAALEAADSKEKKDREALMPAKEVKERKKDAAAQDEPVRKIPSLLKPGEEIGQPVKPQN